MWLRHVAADIQPVPRHAAHLAFSIVPQRTLHGLRRLVKRITKDGHISPWLLILSLNGWLGNYQAIRMRQIPAPLFLHGLSMDRCMHLFANLALDAKKPVGAASNYLAPGPRGLGYTVKKWTVRRS